MIKFYSNNCPKCKMIKSIMNTNEIEYTEVNDEEIYMKIADDNKIMSMPFAEIDGIIYKTKDLQAYILDMTTKEE